MTTTQGHIPVIDFQNFLTGDDTQKLTVAKQFTEACRTFGFAYLKNYGIKPAKVDHMFQNSKNFFDCDLEIKKSAPKDHVTFTGYDELETEKLSADRPGDLKESFMIKQVGTPWPKSDMETFKKEMLEFHSECYSVADKFVKALLLGLDIDESTFHPKFGGECTVLRLLHYPPTLRPILANQLRCAEHTDYGAVTLLFQDPVGGLEIKTSDNDEWLPAAYMPDTVIVNIGNCMEMWTNGYLRSTPHRVVNPSGEQMSLSRYSSAFFFDPDFECELKSLDKFKGLKNELKSLMGDLRAKNYKEYVTKVFDATYPNSGHDFESKM